MPKPSPTRTDNTSCDPAQAENLLMRRLGARRAADAAVRASLLQNLIAVHMQWADNAAAVATDSPGGAGKAHADTAEMILLLTEADALRAESRHLPPTYTHYLLDPDCTALLRELVATHDLGRRAELTTALADGVRASVGDLAATTLRRLAYRQLRAGRWSRAAALATISAGREATAS